MSPQLAVDCGASKTICAIHQDGEIIRRQTVPSRSFDGLESLLQTFLAGEPVARATVAVPGTVVDGRCRLPLLGWNIDEGDLAAAIGAPLTLINDVVATAHGIATVPAKQRFVLHDAPSKDSAPQLVLAVGTGLGAAWVTPGGSVFPAEIGHAPWAGETGHEQTIAKAIQSRHGFCNVQSVVSGQGLLYVWEALNDSSPPGHAVDPGPYILEGVDEAVQVVEAICQAIAMVCRSCAFHFLPYGGLFLAGGMAARLRPWLEQTEWRSRFLASPDLREVIEAMPVTLIADADAALFGAIHTYT